MGFSLSSIQQFLSFRCGLEADWSINREILGFDNITKWEEKPLSAGICAFDLTTINLESASPASEWSLCMITACILFSCVWRGKVMTDGLFSVNRYKLPNLEEEEALWHLAAPLSLCDEELYLLSYSFLPPALHHLLIDVHSLRLIYLLSFLLPHTPCSPSSFLNQTLTGGGVNPLLPKGLPVNFLLWGLIQ